MSFNCGVCARVISVGCAVGALSAVASGQVILQKVAVIGDATPHGAFSYDLGQPTINAGGVLAFEAATRIGPHDYPSVWSGTPGALTARVLTGETVMTPQGPVVLEPGDMRPVRINSSGQIAVITRPALLPMAR